LPDYLQIWPGHGAGSACGKALGAIPSTTLGYEKLANPAFQFEEEKAFVDWLLDGQPEPPRYFAQMKRVNKEGPALLHTLPQPIHHQRPQLDALLTAGGQVFDLRDRGLFAWGHVPGTVNIPAGETNYTTYVGWLVDYEQPLALILPDLDALPTTLADLRAIGVDNVTGYYGPDVAAESTQPLPVITAEELAQRMTTNNILVIDVRGRSEHKEEHIQGALNIPLGFLPRRLAEVPVDKEVVTQCVSGYRSQIAASLLQAAGFSNVHVLTSHMNVWSKLLPTESAA
jgi:hydroxyacylglutathione hydrolase